MPEIQIRPANVADMPHMIAIDHNYSSDYVWQLEIQQEEGQTNIHFRQMHLPRSVRVEYPRSPKLLADDWNRRSGLLVAVLEGEVVGYISLMQNRRIALLTNVRDPSRQRATAPSRGAIVPAWLAWQ